jgi:chromosome partitioning protein
MTIVTIANQKGGVAKTTTAVNLGHGAAMRGLSVLVVDLDTQGNVADALGMDEGSDLYEWLITGKDTEQVAQPTGRENLRIIRSNKTTAQLKVAASGMDFREMIIANALQAYEYDLVILDCPPSVDILHTAALVAADWLLIPTKLDQFAIKGVIEMLRSLDSVQRATRSNCKLAGIIPTFYDQVTSESHAQLQNLAEQYKSYVWPPVAADTNCRVANRVGKTLWEMPVNARAKLGYAACLERLLKII